MKKEDSVKYVYRFLNSVLLTLDYYFETCNNPPLCRQNNPCIIEPMKEYKEKASGLLARIEEAKKILKIADLKSQAADLEKESAEEGFWNDSEKASRKMSEIADLRKQVASWEDLETRTRDILEIIEITSDSDHTMVNDIEKGLETIETELDKAEFTMLFSGEYDKSSAILSVYAGSGGVDAQDWAEMLLKMYLKFAEKQGYKASIMSISSGDEAGIKSVTVEVNGMYAYGYLRSEAGVHRLVRISPYDADKARHTSFALVDVIPEIETESSEIDEKDLKIETYRASGHGGQSVNTTDSAVRITHIPTGLSATSQKERSQLQNKNAALKVLSSRLRLFEEKKARKEISEIRGEAISAEWGNQIRSYVLHPYNMVKDHRTATETSDTNRVLNGNIDEFIESYLKDSIAGK